MLHTNYIVRLITKEDNAAVAALIKSVLTEFGFGKGSAAEDTELNDLYSHFNKPEINGLYLVACDDTGKIVGGGGIATLTGASADDTICEVQKFYFLPEARGKGIGKRLFTQLIEKAKSMGYSTAYLESANQLTNAVRLFGVFGFERCNKIGTDNRHQVCDVHMKLKL